jgi:hypothetical protein
VVATTSPCSGTPASALYSVSAVPAGAVRRWFRAIPVSQLPFTLSDGLLEQGVTPSAAVMFVARTATWSTSGRSIITGEPSRGRPTDCRRSANADAPRASSSLSSTSSATPLRQATDPNPMKASARLSSRRRFRPEERWWPNVSIGSPGKRTAITSLRPFRLRPFRLYGRIAMSPGRGSLKTSRFRSGNWSPAISRGLIQKGSMILR